MREDKTKETKDRRTFEERVFARFDAIDNRFDGMDKRFSVIDERFERVEGRLAAVEIKITKLEARQYDTKPIWERVLVEMGELRQSFDAISTNLRAEFQTANEALRNDLRAEFQTGVKGLRQEMRAEFAAVRHTMEHELRGVGRKIDTLNHNFLEIRADQRYVDRRLEELESQTKT